MSIGRRPKAGKPQQSNVDKILAHLPKEVCQSFMDWCWHQPSYADMSRRLDELIDEHPDCFEGLTEGQDFSRATSINCCYLWYQRNYPVGDEIKEFNSMLRLYQGVEHDKIPQQLLVKVVRLSGQIFERLSDEALAGVDSNTLMMSLPAMVREIRSIIRLTDLHKKITNLHQDRMQAVQIAMMAILHTAKDQPWEEAVKAATIDAMLEVEAWSKANLD